MIYYHIEPRFYNYRIVEVEVQKETETCVWIKEKRFGQIKTARHHKHTVGGGHYFSNFEDACEFATNKIERVLKQTADKERMLRASLKIIQEQQAQQKEG